MFEQDNFIVESRRYTRFFVENEEVLTKFAVKINSQTVNNLALTWPWKVYTYLYPCQNAVACT